MCDWDSVRGLLWEGGGAGEHVTVQPGLLWGALGKSLHPILQS